MKAPKPPTQAVGYGVIAGLVLFGVGYGAVRMAQRPPPMVLVEEPDKPQPAPVASEPPAPESIEVDVVGAVLHPGLYTLPAGKRVNDAVKAAGGPTTNADMERINRASRLSDGDQIRVPRKGEVVERTKAPVRRKGVKSKSPTPPTGRLSVNTATAEQLATIPGIGMDLARKIVDYRLSHHGVRAISELRSIPGVGDVRFSQLMRYLRL